jgi:hypothetical protein
MKREVDDDDNDNNIIIINSLLIHILNSTARGKFQSQHEYKTTQINSDINK